MLHQYCRYLQGERYVRRPWHSYLKSALPGIQSSRINHPLSVRCGISHSHQLLTRECHPMGLLLPDRDTRWPNRYQRRCRQQSVQSLSRLWELQNRGLPFDPRGFQQLLLLRYSRYDMFHNHTGLRLHLLYCCGQDGRRLLKRCFRRPRRIKTDTRNPTNPAAGGQQTLWR